jgi:DNA repair exonuclease SbcCD ATPase subunit
LGFAMVLSEMTGFVPSVMLLDEVLGKLSDDNRSNFVKILDYVGKKGFKQVLLITHTEVKDYLSQTITVRKVVLKGGEKVSEVAA